MARLVKREETPDKRRQRERRGKKEGSEEAKEGTGREGVHSTRENVKRRTSIKSARDGGRVCVAARERLGASVLCIFA